MSTSVFQIPKNTGFTYGAPKVPNVTPNSAMAKARNLLNSTIETVKGTAVGRAEYMSYFFSILVVIFAILMFIHYFVTPIWQLNPGGPGIIPIPGMSDASVYWRNVKDEQVIQDASSSFANISANWSMSLDIFVSEPFIQDTKPRIIFARCKNNSIHLSSSVLITDSISDSNLTMSIIPSTNDLLVSALNSDNLSEDILIPNIPVQKPFRIGVVLFDSHMEVYINGMLYKTRQFSSSVKQVGGSFRPVPSPNINKTVYVKNLILWSRTVSPSEIRYAKPVLASASEFDSNVMTTGSQCVSNIEQTASTALTAVDKAVTNASASITR